MNFLFAIGSTVLTTLIFVIFYYFTNVKKVIPRKAFWSLYAFVMLVIIYNASMTYGPRYSLSSQQAPRAQAEDVLPEDEPFIPEGEDFRDTFSKEIDNFKQ